MSPRTPRETVVEFSPSGRTTLSESVAPALLRLLGEVGDGPSRHGPSWEPRWSVLLDVGVEEASSRALRAVESLARAETVPWTFLASELPELVPGPRVPVTEESCSGHVVERVGHDARARGSSSASAHRPGSVTRHLVTTVTCSCLAVATGEVAGSLPADGLDLTGLPTVLAASLLSRAPSVDAVSTVISGVPLEWALRRSGERVVTQHSW